MDKNKAFSILQLELTTDIDAINEAYHSLVRTVNPEDDQQGFINLRAAYETAVEYARTADNNEDDITTELKNNLENIYYNLKLRQSDEVWDDFFENEAFEDISQFNTARETVLVFMLNHCLYTYYAYNKICEVLCLKEDKDELINVFPTEFIEFLIRNAEYKRVAPLEYLVATENPATDSIDKYLGLLTEVTAHIENRDIEKLEATLKELKEFPFEHPGFEIAELRYNVLLSNLERAEETYNIAISKKYNGVGIMDTNVQYFKAALCEYLVATQQVEEAHDLAEYLAESLKEINGYLATKTMAKYYYAIENYDEALKIIYNLTSSYMNPADMEDMEKLKLDISKAKIKLNEEKLCKYDNGELEDEKREDILLSLAEFMYEAKLYTETVKLLKDNYINDYPKYFLLLGRSYIGLKDYDSALTAFKDVTDKCNKAIEIGILNEEDANYDKFLGHVLKAGALYEKNMYDEMCEEYYKALPLCSDKNESTRCYSIFTQLLLDSKRYEECAKVVEEAINDVGDEYQLILNRLKAHYNLENYNEVMRDCYILMDKDPYYFEPYAYAIELYRDGYQPEDAQAIIDRAEEWEVKFSLKMILYKVRVQLDIQQDISEEELKRLLKDLDEIIEKFNNNSAEKDIYIDIDNLADVYFEKAIIHNMLKDWNKAMLYVNKAISIDKEPSNYYAFKADLYWNHDNYKAALKLYEKVIVDYPNSIRMNYTKAYCEYKLEKYEEAIKGFERVLELEPENYSANAVIAQCYESLYRNTMIPQYYDEAENHFLRQIQNCHQDDRAYYFREAGNFYLSMQQVDRAIKCFEKSLPIEDIAYTRRQMGIAYMMKSDYTNAITNLRLAMEMLEQPDYNLVDTIISCYRQTYEYDKALEWLNIALEMFKNEREDIYETMAAVYEACKNREKAIEYYKKCIDNKADLYKQLAEVEATLGDVKQAKKYIEKYRKTSKEDETTVSINVAQFSMNYLLDYQTAAAYFEKVYSNIEKIPNNVGVIINVAMSYFNIGELLKARDVAKCALNVMTNNGKIKIEDYIAFKPYPPIQLSEYGRICYILGDVDKARECFEKMNQTEKCRHCTSKGCFEGPMYRARILIAEGKKEEGIELLREAYELCRTDETVLALLREYEK